MYASDKQFLCNVPSIINNENLRDIYRLSMSSGNNMMTESIETFDAKLLAEFSQIQQQHSLKAEQSLMEVSSKNNVTEDSTDK